MGSGARTDAALALLALAAFVALGVALDASISVFYLLCGAVATVAFELLAARDPDLVRRYWERRRVQLASLLLAVGAAAIGARVAPTVVVSLCVGAAIAYLVLLTSIQVGLVPPLRTWWEEK